MRWIICSALLCICIRSGLTACVEPAPTCRLDEECLGEEVCAFGTCEVIACNVDDDCSGRMCSAGVCAPGTPTARPAPNERTLEGPCGDVKLLPADGEEAVSPLTEVRVSFGSEADADSAKIVVDGLEAFRRLRDGDTVVVVPLQPLTDGKSYSVTVTLPCGDIVSTFTVRAPRVPRAALRASWTLQTSSMLPVSARNLFTMLGLPALRVSLDDTGGLLGFENGDGTQELCEATVPLRTVVEPSPVWTANGFVDTLDPSSVGLRELYLRAVPTAAGPELAGFAELDARKLAHYVLDDCVDGSPMFPGCVDLACAIVSSALTCEPCSDGAPYCFHFSVHGLAAPALAPAPIATTEVCANIACVAQPECQ